jgi:hypothetical protein
MARKRARFSTLELHILYLNDTPACGQVFEFYFFMTSQRKKKEKKKIDRNNEWRIVGEEEHYRSIIKKKKDITEGRGRLGCIYFLCIYRVFHC